jgi:hypothetical protein
VRQTTVLDLDHDADTLGRELGAEPFGGARGERFLGVDATGEHLDCTRELRETHDVTVRDVPDVRESAQLLLAHPGRPERDVRNDDELVVAGVVVEGGESERRGDPVVLARAARSGGRGAHRVPFLR